jgi:hypothetical protein
VGLSTFQPYAPYEQVDEMASVTDMTGDATAANQKKGALNWWHDPSKSMIILWVAALLLYWFIGYYFRGVRS